MSEPKDDPNIHPQVQPFFIDFDYRRPKVAPERLVMSHPDNVVGHQQRCHSVWWALRQCGPLDLGLDIGSPRSMTPYCIHVDVNGTGDPHPFYPGGAYRSDVVADASDLSGLLPRDTFPLIVSNHSLEHMPATKFGGGDQGIVEVLKGWIRLLRQGGVLAMVVPDNAYWDVLGGDKDHKHAWSNVDFRPRVLDKVLAAGTAELVEYNTFHNNFSFDLMLRRK